MIKPCVFHQIIHGHRRHTPPSGRRASMSSGSRPAGPALGHDSVRGGGGVQVRAVRNGALGHPAVIWAGDTVAANNAPIMTNYVRIPRQQPSPRRAAARRSSVQRPGDAGFSLAGSSNVGAGCARGRGFDVEEYAQRIYRANINLVLAEVPRDYSKPAQAPDF